MSYAQMARDAWEVLLPRSCAGCGQPGAMLCSACAGLFRGPVVVPELAVRRELRNRDVVACAAYSPRVRRVVGAFKDGGAHRLAPLLAAPMAEVLTRLCGHDHAALALVPVPSSLAGWMRRGYEPTVLLARALANTTPSTSYLPALRRDRLRGRGTAHFGRSRADRLSRGAKFVAHPGVRGRLIVLIDDVVTTGATLEAAAAALGRAGGQVVAAVCSVATLRPHEMDA